MIKIKIHSRRAPDEVLFKKVIAASLFGDGVWKNLKVTLDNDYDFICILDIAHQNYKYDSKKAILVSAECPIMRNRFAKKVKKWGLNSEYYFKYDPDIYHTIDCWFHNLSYKSLLDPFLFEKSKQLSSIISSLQNRPGQQARCFFLRLLKDLVVLDHFGRGWNIDDKYYKGSLLHKEDGLLNYKYHFNCENQFHNNYFTEKIIDPILCETLCFYDGCPNIENFIDPESYIRIDVQKPEEACEIVIKSMVDNLWEKRLPAIKAAKKKLMEEDCLLNIIWKIVNGKI